MDKLDKKLAEWAGFHITHPEIDAAGNKGISILTPQGKLCLLPRFTTSLDACFEWLVPKLVNNSPAQQVDIRVCITDNVYYAVTIRQSKGIFADELLSVGESENNPAPALCKAVEKLIDGTSK